MDWQGQKHTEKLMQILLGVFAVGAFGTGYVLGSLPMILFIYAGGVALTTLITVPNWPFFNCNPLVWLDPSKSELHPKPQEQLSAKKKPTKQNYVSVFSSKIYLDDLGSVVSLYVGD